MDRLNILHVLSQRPDSTGSGIYIQAMIREARKQGYENFLVAGIQSDRGAKVEELEPDSQRFVTFNGGDISYRIPGMSDVMPYESSRFCDLSEKDFEEYEDAFTGVLQTAVARFQPEIIHSHHLWILTSLVRRLFPEIPLVTSCHGSDLRQFENCPHLRERVVEGCRGIDAVTALSIAQKRDILRLYPLPEEKIHVTGGGYNSHLFCKEVKPDPDPVQLVYAGKLSNAKGIPWLLRSLHSLESPPWKLNLVGSGSGEEEANCLKLAKELGERVVIHGSLPQHTLAEVMRSSHILVLPSFYEGLPLVLLEGLASGCRIVATDLPGTREVLGSTGSDFINLVRTPRLRFMDQPYREDEEVFEENLAEALQSQMSAACECPQINLSSIQDLLDSFTWKGVFGKVRDVYASCQRKGSDLSC